MAGEEGKQERRRWFGGRRSEGEVDEGVSVAFGSVGGVSVGMGEMER